MPVNLYYTQKVRGFQQEKVKYSKESVEIRLKRTKHQCPYCGSSAVTVEPIRRRREIFWRKGTGARREIDRDAPPQ